MYRTVFILSSVFIFYTQTTFAQTATGLYHHRFHVLHSWDEYIIVDKDTAFYYLLTEIHYQGIWSKPDTFIRQQDNSYTGTQGTLVQEKEGLYYIRASKKKHKKPILLTPANNEIRTEWTRLHIKLMQPGMELTPGDSVNWNNINNLYLAHIHLGTQ